MNADRNPRNPSQLFVVVLRDVKHSGLRVVHAREVANLDAAINDRCCSSLRLRDDPNSFGKKLVVVVPAKVYRALNNLQDFGFDVCHESKVDERIEEKFQC